MNQAVVYSRANEGQLHLSESFKVAEFSCNDGSDVVIVDPLLIWILQNVRDHFGAPLYIMSGYRTPDYNARINGAEHSYHTRGMAADISFDEITPDEIAEYLETIMPNTGGIGIYEDFVHVDTRHIKYRWRD